MFFCQFDRYVLDRGGVLSSLVTAVNYDSLSLFEDCNNNSKDYKAEGACVMLQAL